jgi:hypothetical protein
MEAQVFNVNTFLIIGTSGADCNATTLSKKSQTQKQTKISTEYIHTIIS